MASIHRFWIYLDSVYLYVLFGVSFNRFGRIMIKLQKFFGEVCVFQAYKFSRKQLLNFKTALSQTVSEIRH